VVFELTKNSNGKWTENVLHSMAATDGGSPLGPVVFDGAGNLYAAAQSGGTFAQGTIRFSHETDGCHRLRWTSYRALGGRTDEAYATRHNCIRNFVLLKKFRKALVLNVNVATKECVGCSAVC
jgi:hypothetical protein